MSVAKNPTIRLQEGSEDAYLAAIITVTFADASIYASPRRAANSTNNLFMFKVD